MDEAVALFRAEQRRLFEGHVRQVVRWFAIDLKHPSQRKQYLDDLANPESIHYEEPEYRERLIAAVRQQWTFNGRDRKTGQSMRYSWDWQGARDE